MKEQPMLTRIRRMEQKRDKGTFRAVLVLSVVGVLIPVGKAIAGVL